MSSRASSAKRSYTSEFKREAARLVIEQKRSFSDVTKELGISDSALRKWVLEYTPVSNTLAYDERVELQQLRKENARLKMEHEILKKAAAFFAKEIR